MHKLLTSLAAAAAFLPSAAFAQDFTPAQSEEIKCVYAALDADQRNLVLQALYDDQEESDKARTAVQPAMTAAEDACTKRYNWGAPARSAGEEYTVALVGYEGVAESMPEELAKKLDTLMGSFTSDYAQTYSQLGHAAVTDEDGWEKDAFQRMGAAGVAEGDYNASVIYLAALADLSVAGAHWNELLTSGQR